jgi:hypothetical protein
MSTRLDEAGKFLRVGLGLAVMALLILQSRPAPAGLLWHKHAKADSPDSNQKKGDSASLPAAFTIPVEPLGFSPPGVFYTGLRESLVSLDFIDENRLLFTFRAPGLIHRASPGEGEERQIRAQVLALPQGTVQSEALWTLHDHERYLWMLHDGHFLLRDGDTVKEGNARLELRPLLEFPGPLLSLEMDPAQRLLVTNSDEPADRTPQQGQVDSPPTAAARVLTDISGDTGQRDIVLRILDRASGHVMLVSRVRRIVDVPINSDGYMETLRGIGQNWVLSLDYFTGGSKVVSKLDSYCQPPIAFVSPDEAVVNTCGSDTGRRLVALSTTGQRLWDASSPPTQVWPLLIMAPDGSRVARETLTLDHPVDDFAHPMDTQDIKGQLVEIFDAVGGALALKARANPILDAGGNVAISPSGNRVAILNEGAIQVYELPAPHTALPESNPSAQ